MALVSPHPVILSAPSTPATNPGAGGGAADTPNRAGLLVEDVGADEFEFAVAIEVHGTARRLGSFEQIIDEISTLELRAPAIFEILSRIPLLQPDALAESARLQSPAHGCSLTHIERDSYRKRAFHAAHSASSANALGLNPARTFRRTGKICNTRFPSRARIT